MEVIYFYVQLSVMLNSLCENFKRNLLKGGFLETCTSFWGDTSLSDKTVAILEIGTKVNLNPENVEAYTVAATVFRVFQELQILSKFLFSSI